MKISTPAAICLLLAFGCKNEVPYGSTLAEAPIQYSGEVVDASGAPINQDIFAAKGGLLVVVDPTYGKQLPRLTTQDLRTGAASPIIESTFAPQQNPAATIAQGGATVNAGISTVQQAWKTSGFGQTAMGSVVETAATSAATTVRDQYNDYWAKTPVLIAVDQEAVVGDVADATGARGLGRIAIKAAVNGQTGPQLQQNVGVQSQAVNTAIDESLSQTNEKLFGETPGFAQPNIKFGVGTRDLHQKWKTKEQPVDGAYRIYRVNSTGQMTLLNGSRSATTGQAADQGVKTDNK